MAHITRRQLKQDQLKTTVEEFQEFAKARYKEIISVTAIVVVVVGLAGALKIYVDRQQEAANLALATALKTFGAYVGPTSQSPLLPGMQSFPAAEEKYKKALEQFTELIQKYSRYPQPKAVGIARYHVGLCQAELGQHEAAMKTLREAAADSDPSVASLARLALGSELAKDGKLEEAVRLYEELASHPTATVPEATAKLALADAYRSTQPAKAREIYEQLEKQFGSDLSLAQSLKEQIASLPQ